MKKCLSVMLFVMLFMGVVNAQNAGTISGYMFGDYSYNIAHDTSTSLPKAALAGPKDMNAFQFRRIYFTYDNKISDNFVTRFRLEADQAANTSNGKIGVAVKDAYLGMKNVFKGSDLYFGIIPTTFIDMAETNWGYCSLEKTITDLRGIISSRDLGVSLKGKIDESGIFSYAVMIGDNSGNAPATTKFKRYYLQLSAKPVNNMLLSLYGDMATRAQINDPTSTAAPKATLNNNTTTIGGMVGYSEKDVYSVGAEVFSQSQANGYKQASGTLTSLTAFGLSIYGNVNLQSDLILIARYDDYDPNTNSASNHDARNYFIFGLSYKADKNVSIIPNVQYETYQKGVPTGDPKASLTARVTFHWIFL